MKNFTEKKLFILLLLSGLLAFFLVILILSDGFVGGADNMTHYRYSRYAYQHPEFFLWHWGKPVFTILTSPFAQLGFIGVQIFNLICGLLSAYLSYLIVKEFKFQNSWLTIILICFIPIYTVMMISGMTEVLFSLITIFSAYLFIKDKAVLSAIILSFAPLARTEGIFIIGVFGLAFLIYKKYRAIPFLATGFVLFSLIGAKYYNDIFWLITKMPYNGYKVYGTGKLLHFVNTSPRYFGVIITTLISLGTISIIIKSFLKKRKSIMLLFVVLFPFLIYLAAHSLMWYTGYGNSAGYSRYMAGIAPFAGILAFIGLNQIISSSQNLLSKFKSNKNLNKFMFGFLEAKSAKIILLFVFLGFIVIAPFKTYSIPVPYDPAQVVIKSFSEWYLNSDYNKRKIYYYHPDIPYFLDINPYDESTCHVLVPNYKTPHEYVEPGSLILWDSYFSEMNRLKLSTLRENEYLDEIKIFGDTNIVVFERLPSSNVADSSNTE